MDTLRRVFQVVVILSGCGMICLGLLATAIYIWPMIAEGVQVSPSVIGALIGAGIALMILAKHLQVD